MVKCLYWHDHYYCKKILLRKAISITHFADNSLHLTNIVLKLSYIFRFVHLFEIKMLYYILIPLLTDSKEDFKSWK